MLSRAGQAGVVRDAGSVVAADRLLGGIDELLGVGLHFLRSVLEEVVELRLVVLERLEEVLLAAGAADRRVQVGVGLAERRLVAVRRPAAATGGRHGEKQDAHDAEGAYPPNHLQSVSWC